RSSLEDPRVPAGREPRRRAAFERLHRRSYRRGSIRVRGRRSDLARAEAIHAGEPARLPAAPQLVAVASRGGRAGVEVHQDEDCMLSITPPIKINACCGDRPRSGYVNIDIVASADGGPAPDIVCNALSVPLPDGCAEEIMCIHGFEHFYRWECDNLVLEWKRLLMPGGRLVLELPDLLKCCQNILAELEIPGRNPDQSGMWGLYGDPRL